MSIQNPVLGFEPTTLLNVSLYATFILSTLIGYSSYSTNQNA